MQEYTVEAIEDRLFRIKSLAHECTLNHPESKVFCTEIQHISKELREAIRSRPHTSTMADVIKELERRANMFGGEYGVAYRSAIFLMKNGVEK